MLHLRDVYVLVCKPSLMPLLNSKTDFSFFNEFSLYKIFFLQTCQLVYRVGMGKDGTGQNREGMRCSCTLLGLSRSCPPPSPQPSDHVPSLPATLSLAPLLSSTFSLSSGYTLLGGFPLLNLLVTGASPSRWVA